VVSRWFLWAFCGMGVKVVRESVKSGRKSRCFEIRAGSCVDKRSEEGAIEDQRWASVTWRCCLHNKSIFRFLDVPDL
jgi:hypothetical protein